MRDRSTRRTKIATIRDVAQRAGVSYTTVSHVINGTRRVSIETAARVEKAIKELHFRPCSRARGLRTGQSGLIGILTAESEDPFFSEVLVGVEDACKEFSIGMLVCHSNGNVEAESDSIGMLISKGVDALVLNNFIGSEESFSLLDASGIPVVILQARSPGPPAEIVATDDLAGGRDAVAYLTTLGHCRIACVAGAAQPHHGVNFRRIGYLESLRAAGIKARDDYFICGDYTFESGYTCFKALRALEEPPTAFFLYSDVMAMGALRAAADLALRVPEDVSIVGYDDIALASFSTPRLTTVRQPKAKLGDIAVRKAVERVQGKDAPMGATILPVSLEIRESAGPVPSSSNA